MGPQESTPRVSFTWLGWAVAALICLTALAWSPRFFFGALRHWDEAWYAEVSREMLDTGSGLTVRWNDAPWFHKPPLVFWGMEASYRLFGISEPSARLFPALCGLLTVAALAIFASRQRSLEVGLAAGLVLALIPEFARYATRAQLDAPIALWITLQLICFWRGRERPAWHLAGGVAFGLGLMTKGAAAGLAALVQGAYCLAARDGRCFRQPAWWISWFVGIAIAVPWHLHQYLTHGDLFLADYLDRHMLQFFRDIYPEVDHAGAPWWYYADFLLRKESAWGWGALALWLWSTALLVRQRGDRFFLFAWIWTTSIPLALSLAWAKWSWYLLPAYPGFALLSAMTLERTLQSQPQAAKRVLATALLALFVVSAAEGVWTPANKDHEEEIRSLGPAIMATVPQGGAVITVQTESARASVYPTAVRFYGRRTIRVADGVDRLVAMAEEAEGPFFAVMTQQVAENFVKRGRESGAKRFQVEPIRQAGAIVLVRIMPARWLDSARQAARKRVESR